MRETSRATEDAGGEKEEEGCDREAGEVQGRDRKSRRLNSSHPSISYAGCCLKKKILPVLNLSQLTNSKILDFKPSKLSFCPPEMNTVSGCLAFNACTMSSLALSVLLATLIKGTPRCSSLFTSLLISIFFNAATTTKIYTLSLHDALPI